MFLCLCFGKSLITFEQLNRFGQNFQCLVDWSGPTYWWVVPVPSPHPVELGLNPVFPGDLSPPWLWALPGCVIPF